MVVMNKRGITFLYTLMVGITLVILALALAGTAKVFSDDSRTQLTCATPANDFDAGTCILLDSFKWFAVGIILFVGILILGKTYIGGSI